MSFLKQDKGFTRIELVCAISVISILVIIVLGIISTGTHARASINLALTNETEARTAMSRVALSVREYDLKGAVDVVTPKFLTFTDDPQSAESGGSKLWFEDGTVYFQEFLNIKENLAAGAADVVAKVADLKVGCFCENNCGRCYSISVCYADVLGRNEEIFLRMDPCCGE